MSSAEPVNWRIAAQRLWSAFPTYPPSKVVDENFGEYAEAAQFFETYRIRGWTSSDIMENRSTVAFVNDEAFVFMLPHYLVASYDGEDINWDVFEYVLSEIPWRLASRRKICLTSEQAQAAKTAIESISQHAGYASSCAKERIAECLMLCDAFRVKSTESPDEH